MNFKEYFDIYRKDDVLEKYGFHMKDTFTKTLNCEITGIQMGYYELNHPQYNRTWVYSRYRDTIGYDGIGRGTAGILSGVRTEAIDLMYKNNGNRWTGIKPNPVHDHLFSATGIGEIVIDEFIKNDLNVPYMVNVWLPENLFLWGTVRVTKEEHNKSNILQGTCAQLGMTIEQRINFKHYVNTSKIVYPTV
tara:strand:+ start:1456 stop:2028 length:573 start_codon:yes stop_codon:yes gene_type:complete